MPSTEDSGSKVIILVIFGVGLLQRFSLKDLAPLLDLGNILFTDATA